MNQNDKIQKLDELANIDDVLIVIQNILKDNFSNIEIVGSLYVFADMQTPIGIQKIAVYPSHERLSGDYKNFRSLLENIEYLSKLPIDKIIIASTKNITEGFKKKLRSSTAQSVDFWENNVLLNKIEESFPEFWRHTDQHLISYEKAFEEDLMQDWSLNRVKQIKTANEKLLKIFIEPRLYLKRKDLESKNATSVKIPITKTIDYQLPVVLYGEAGVGKTRTLKQIGLEHIKHNALKKGKHFLPIFINNIDLLENKKHKNLVSVVDALEKKIVPHFKEETLISIKDKYDLVILVDSVDDFSDENQQHIVSELIRITKDNSHKFFIGTRVQELSQSKTINLIDKKEEIRVEKFNENQIRLFLSSYFQNDSSKAQDLLESLKENSIIQRLPITPLNLSLISILYEENNFEIPATITDIYDNFNNLLLGRTLADKRLDFFDITFRERVLSLYALELLSKEERSYMTKDEFESFFIKYFEENSSTLNMSQLPEALKFIVENTGILVLQDGKYVRFLHESYMEYYASREIFIYQRELESLLVDNFLNVSWQYTSIFYAGRSKQMDDFLKKVIDFCDKNSVNAQQYLSSIHGLGYLLQSLYLSNDNIRKSAVLNSLKYSLEILDWMKKSGADDKYFFKTLNLPVAIMINSMFFIDNFNSITLKGPLIKAFDELFDKLEIEGENNSVKIDSNVGYKLFTIALTLATPRIGQTLQMERLLETPILNDPLFERLLDFGVTIAKSKELYNIKEKLKSPSRDINKTGANYNKHAIDIFLSTPVGRLRFTQYDRIRTERKYLLLTEGKTDAQIIEHAFITLTGHLPYWEIRSVNDGEGGAKEVANSLLYIDNIAKDFDGVIGIFDNDNAGITCFKGYLESSKYECLDNSERIKKHKRHNVYGMKLPIPHFRENYLKKEQEFNFFELEHYFDDDFLRSHHMLEEESVIPEIYRIKNSSSAKTGFSKKIREVDDPLVFRNFIILFKEIDYIFDVANDIEYKD